MWKKSGWTRQKACVIPMEYVECISARKQNKNEIGSVSLHIYLWFGIWTSFAVNRWPKCASFLTFWEKRNYLKALKAMLRTARTHTHTQYMPIIMHAYPFSFASNQFAYPFVWHWFPFFRGNETNSMDPIES